MRWYRTRSYEYDIVPVEVIHETKHSVRFRDGGLARKTSESDQYHPTFGDAWRHLHARLLRHHASAERRLAELQRAIDNLQRMTPPDAAP